MGIEAIHKIGYMHRYVLFDEPSSRNYPRLTMDAMTAPLIPSGLEFRVEAGHDLPQDSMAAPLTEI
jgi:hypothetical protein